MIVKRIVFIAESIDTNDSSCTKCNVALIKNLKAIGYEIIVYHYTRYKVDELQDIDCRPIKEIKFSTNFFLSRLQRVLSRKFNIRVHTFFERLFGFSFSFFNDVNSIKRIIPEVIQLHPDLVFTVSKGTSFRPHYALLSFPKIHSKWVANIHDPYPFHFNPRPYNWVEPGYAIKEKFFVITVERKLCHPAALAVSEAARHGLFTTLTQSATASIPATRTPSRKKRSL